MEETAAKTVPAFWDPSLGVTWIPYGIAHVLHTISVVVYVVYFIPQLVHSARDAWSAMQISLIWQSAFFFAAACDLTAGLAPDSGVTFQYNLVSVVMLVALLVQEALILFAARHFHQKAREPAGTPTKTQSPSNVPVYADLWPTLYTIFPKKNASTSIELSHAVNNGKSTRHEIPGDVKDRLLPLWVYISHAVGCVVISALVIVYNWFQVTTDDDEYMGTIKMIGKTLATVSCTLWPCLWLPQIYKNFEYKSTAGHDKVYLFLNLVANILDNICYRCLLFPTAYQFSAGAIFVCMCILHLQERIYKPRS